MKLDKVPDQFIIRIFKELNIAEQFRFARTSKKYRNIFECYIFPQEKFNTLHIVGNDDYVVVANETQRNRIPLQPIEFQEFLMYHQHEVRMIEEIQGVIVDIKPFQYLTKLCYSRMNIPLEYLENLYRICPKLELLHLDSCFDDNGEGIIVARNLRVNTLIKMKNLTSLQVNFSNTPQKWVPLTYQDLLELITKLKLEYLNLDCIVQPTYDVLRQPELISPRTVSLSKLTIGFKFQPQSHAPLGPQPNLRPYFVIFKNLVSLTMFSPDTINQYILENITMGCSNLQVLHMQYLKFRVCSEFIIPPMVIEFSLCKCEGLTETNLKDILLLNMIKKFSSQKTRYDEEPGAQHLPFSLVSYKLNHSKISNITKTISTIQEIHFESDYSHKYENSTCYDSPKKITLAFAGSQYLKKLSWNNQGSITSTESDNQALQKCINLEELDWQTEELSLVTLHQLKLLQKLTITPTMLPSSWSYIISILQHTSLKEFNLNRNGEAVHLRLASDVPTLGFPTTIRIQRITCEIFELASSFWLDLFDRNPEMLLQVYNYRGDVEFIRTLITHEKFPTFLRTLQICCFKIDCEDLKQHFETTMENLNRNIDHLKYENNEQLYSIIFSRQENIYE